MESKLLQSKDNKRKRTLPTPSIVTRSSSRKLSNSASDTSKSSDEHRPLPRIKLVISKPKKQQSPKSIRMTRSHTQAQSKSLKPTSVEDKNKTLSGGDSETKSISPSSEKPFALSSDTLCSKESPNKSISFATTVTQFDEDESMLYSDHENQSDIEDLSDFDDDDLDIEAQSPNKRPKIEHLSFMPMETSKDFYQLTHSSDHQEDGIDNDDSTSLDGEAEEEEEDMPHFHYESRYNATKAEEEEDPYFVSDFEDDDKPAPILLTKALPQPKTSKPQQEMTGGDLSQLSRNPSPSPLDYYSFSDSVESSVSSPRDFDDLMSLGEPLDFVTGEDELDSNLPSLTPFNILNQELQNIKTPNPLDLHHSQELSKCLMKTPHSLNTTSESQEPVSGADEIALRWSQASQRERSNSFSTLINRQSFKRFARVLAKRPHLAATLNDTLSISSVDEETPKDIEASLDQFFDLVDESMVQSSSTTSGQKRNSESSENSSTWTTEQYNKVPLCGYRNRNHTIKVPGGAHLNAKKILAALASISSDNEKLVASFPDSNPLLPASTNNTTSTSSTTINSSTLPVEPSLSTPEFYNDIYPPSVNSQPLTHNHSTINDVMTPISFDNNTTTNNVQQPLDMQKLDSSNNSLISPASSDSAIEFSAEITKSALEYYQQAVVAATGLNLRSLYSGKARETITGEAPVSSVF